MSHTTLTAADPVADTARARNLSGSSQDRTSQDRRYTYDGLTIAVLVPCYNEESTIGTVIEDFRRELPHAVIYVYDNNSTDRTSAVGRAHGAQVRLEPRRGKGAVMRSMFIDIDADLYVLVDGDDTYPAEAVHDLIAPILNREAEMVVGDRHTNGSYFQENTKPLHNFGNMLTKNVINFLFGADLKDIMSGYRVFSKVFLKTLPILSEGFEIESEMSLHALDKRFLIKEVPIQYRDRPAGSSSKISTIKDGIKIIRCIFGVFQHFRPFLFWGSVAVVFLAMSLVMGAALYLKGGVLTVESSNFFLLAGSVGSLLLGFFALSIGFVLHSIVRFHQLDFQSKILALTSHTPRFPHPVFREQSGAREQSLPKAGNY